MSPRVNWFIIFALLPVLASGRGGRGGHSGGYSHGHSSGGYSHGHSGGYSHVGHNTGHSYPSGGSLSGNNNPSHKYPSSPGLSGNNNYNNRPTYTHKTEVHHHYHPPQQVHYGSTYHPVYHGPPPVYVYTYRDSGSRYNDLLTGLALYNLGRMSAHHHDSHYYSQAQSYRSPPGEYCEFQIIKTNGEYEKAKISCQLMSSFILEADRDLEQNRNRVPSNTNTVTTTVVNTTKVEHSADNSTVVTTVQESTTVKDALEQKGPPIQVTTGMDCYMVRYYRDSSHTIKKKVDCGLLKQYAASSFRSDSARIGPVINLVILLCSVVYFLV